MNILNESSSRMTIHEEILEGAIKDVCRRIGFDPNTVMWVIYSVDNNMMQPLMSSWLANCISHQKNQWGYCGIGRNQKIVYISTKTINYSKYMLYALYALPNVFFVDFRKEQMADDILTAVLLDEITHVQTGRDHGNPVYEQQYLYNYNRYKYNAIYI